MSIKHLLSCTCWSYLLFILVLTQGKSCTQSRKQTCFAQLLFFVCSVCHLHEKYGALEQLDNEN